ncbi:MAG TPA: hypothetical protein VGO80_10370 [Solirubrobacteraceae bacterium]|nr:hypothetical protein [Solirubrobacteraceae bacterium]
MSATLVALALAAALSSAPAAAHGANGCGPGDGIGAFIPNAPLGNDFLGACNNHDNCYDSGSSRSACDDRFAIDLQAVCEAQPRFGCDFFAGLYAKMVQLAGQSAWDRAQDERFERFISDLQGCTDTPCERAVADSYDNDVDTLDLPPIDPSGGDSDHGDPGGDFGDPVGDDGGSGDGGGGDFGDSGGDDGGSGDGGGGDFGGSGGGDGGSGDGGGGDFGDSGGGGGGGPFTVEEP